MTLKSIISFTIITVILLFYEPTMGQSFLNRERRARGGGKSSDTGSNQVEVSHSKNNREEIQVLKIGRNREALIFILVAFQ